MASNSSHTTSVSVSHLFHDLLEELAQNLLRSLLHGCHEPVLLRRQILDGSQQFLMFFRFSRVHLLELDDTFRKAMPQPPLAFACLDQLKPPVCGSVTRVFCRDPNDTCHVCRTKMLSFSRSSFPFTDEDALPRIPPAIRVELVLLVLQVLFPLTARGVAGGALLLAWPDTAWNDSVTGAALSGKRKVPKSSAAQRT